jgi:subtilisin family serine protease
MDEAFAFATALSWTPTTPGPSALQIDIVDGHERDVEELRADPQNAVVVDAEIKLCLVDPRNCGPVDPATLKKTDGLAMPDGLVAVGAHTSSCTGQGVTVAVLDSGIDDSHPAFAGRTISKRNFTAQGDWQDVRDTLGHGTHCAGTICGNAVDGVRVGVAPGVTKLCVGKVLGPGGGTLEALLGAMHWAVFQEKASVVSLSLGYDLPGNTQRLIEKGLNPAQATQIALRQQSGLTKSISTLRAFLESQSPNVVFLAATGNESQRPQFVLDAGSPAAELLAVGAVGLAGAEWEVASFSNGSAQVVAPGVDVVSAALGGGWAKQSGTSMATPHVAGIAALWTEKLRNEGYLSIPESVRSALKANATRMPILTKDASAVGAGLVQAPQ